MVAGRGGERGLGRGVQILGWSPPDVGHITHSPHPGWGGRRRGWGKGREGLPRPRVWVPALFQFCVLRSPSTCLGETVTGGKA